MYNKRENKILFFVAKHPPFKVLTNASEESEKEKRFIM